MGEILELNQNNEVNNNAHSESALDDKNKVIKEKSTVIFIISFVVAVLCSKINILSTIVCILSLSLLLAIFYKNKKNGVILDKTMKIAFVVCGVILIITLAYSIYNLIYASSPTLQVKTAYTEYLKQDIDTSDKEITGINIECKDNNGNYSVTGKVCFCRYNNSILKAEAYYYIIDDIVSYKDKEISIITDNSKNSSTGEREEYRKQSDDRTIVSAINKINESYVKIMARSDIKKSLYYPDSYDEISCNVTARYLQNGNIVISVNISYRAQNMLGAMVSGSANKLYLYNGDGYYSY